MSEREQIIIRSILTFLDRLDGGQAVEGVIHAAVQTEMRNHGENPAGLQDLRSCLAQCDAREWVVKRESKVTKRLQYSLSDRGGAALLELQ